MFLEHLETCGNNSRVENNLLYGINIEIVTFESVFQVLLWINDFTSDMLS